MAPSDQASSALPALTATGDDEDVGAEGEGPLGQRRGRILVVDDEPAVRKALARQLRQQGYLVETASDGRSALSLVHGHQYDVVVSDISMPEMDGMALLKAIREHDVELPVVIVTGQPAWETATEALDHRAFKYLPKPMGAEQLFETIERALWHRRYSPVRRSSSISGVSRVVDLDALEADFSAALDRLFVVYQPIILWPERKLVGYEALVRSLEPTMPHPGILLDVAERLDRMHDLGRRVRQLALKGLEQIPEDVKLFINLHTTDLLDGALFDANGPLTGMAHRIVLELTERAKLERVSDVEERVTQLRQMGYSIAIDDLGAGYAGLTSLARLEPDVVKLDMALVRDVDSSATKQKLIGLLVSLCADLGMTVIAEGIETRAERDTLEGLGCSWMQGYLFARPTDNFGPPNLE